MANLDYPLFPIFAFFGFVLPLIPLPWHLQAWNSGTCYFMLWASLACLNQFVNSIIWKGNVINSAPVWCDISVRITMAATAGLPSSSFCIVRRLYGIVSIRTVSISRAEKRRAIIIDSLICVLGPLIYLALQYIVQGHRFNIFEDLGCAPALYDSLPLYFITYSWSIIFGLASAVYCVLTLRTFTRRRLEFAQFLSSSKSLTIGRYFRLMALSMTEMLCTLPLSAITIWFSATSAPMGPWISLSNTHFDFSRVDQYPAVIYNANPRFAASIQFNRWASVACSLIFFLLFGFAEEAQRNYTSWYHALQRLLGFHTTSVPPSAKRKQPFSSAHVLKLDSSYPGSSVKPGIPSPNSSELPAYDVIYPKPVFLSSPVKSSSDVSSTLYSPSLTSHNDFELPRLETNYDDDVTPVHFATAI